MSASKPMDNRVTRVVPLTQYVRPDGRKRQVFDDNVPGELSATVDAIFANGYNFACEDLGDGYVALTIEGPDEDVDIEIVPNRPGQPHVGLVAMIQRFSEREQADGQ